MTRKHRLVALGFVLSFTLSAWAQSQEPPKTPSFIENLIWSVLPFVVIAAFIWFFFVKSFRKLQNTSMEAQKQHNETMEKLLERIVKALEKRDGGSV